MIGWWCQNLVEVTLKMIRLGDNKRDREIEKRHGERKVMNERMNVKERDNLCCTYWWFNSGYKSANPNFKFLHLCAAAITFPPLEVKVKLSVEFKWINKCINIIYWTQPFLLLFASASRPVHALSVFTHKWGWHQVQRKYEAEQFLFWVGVNIDSAVLKQVRGWAANSPHWFMGGLWVNTFYILSWLANRHSCF